jgi:N-acetylglucosaminyldiphosphoundecaprenol N-acetyl-beta-D-mannosaminyltransferase
VTRELGPCGASTTLPEPRAGDVDLEADRSGVAGIRNCDQAGAGPSSARIEFLGIPIDCYSMDEVVELATASMRKRRRLQHGDINVAKFIGCRTDPDLCRNVGASDIICVDGIGILWGCRLFGLPVRERVTGIDLMTRILEVCAREEFRPYFLGARPDVLERMIARVRLRHPHVEVAGWRHGYFPPEQEAQIALDIRASRADCLFVGISSPLKEKFLNRYRDDIAVPLQVGVGGAFDVMAGCLKRAPRWMQTSGLEWLFRLLQEPRRLGPRYLKTNWQYAIILILSLLHRLRLRVRQALVTR